MLRQQIIWKKSHYILRISGRKEIACSTFSTEVDSNPAGAERAWPSKTSPKTFWACGVLRVELYYHVWLDPSCLLAWWFCYVSQNTDLYMVQSLWVNWTQLSRVHLQVWKLKFLVLVPTVYLRGERNGAKPLVSSAVTWIQTCSARPW